MRRSRCVILIGFSCRYGVFKCLGDMSQWRMKPTIQTWNLPSSRCSAPSRASTAALNRWSALSDPYIELSISGVCSATLNTRLGGTRYTRAIPSSSWVWGRIRPSSISASWSSWMHSSMAASLRVSVRKIRRFCNWTPTARSTSALRSTIIQPPVESRWHTEVLIIS
jgi:hypothetical protein